MLHWPPSIQTRALIATGVLLFSLIEGQAYGAPRQQLIPVLGVTTGQNRIGTVVYVMVSFEERQDQTGLRLQFHTTPGRFSTLAQTSIEQAIRRSAQSLGTSTDSWAVELSVFYIGMTVDGNSLSAMVSLSVAAMAQGKTVPTGYVMTGTVTPDGGIGAVGFVPLKVQAAQAANLRRVVVSRLNAPAGSPAGSIHVSPVQSVREALDALTDSSPLKPANAEAELQ
ncbi:MAG: hypothetical protein NT179_04940 [Nitrospirae bacterium]|nr:hypothetical protein [Nitrospirota bacterium]